MEPIRVLRLGGFQKNYLKVSIAFADRGKKEVFVHRLVALNFLSNPNNLPEVDHIDSDKTNNRVENLEWVSKNENMKRAKEKGRIRNGENHCRAKLKLKQVNEMRMIKKTNPEITTIELGKVYGVTSGQVSRILNYKKWVAYLLVIVVTSACSGKVICHTYDSTSQPGSGYFKPKSR